MRPESVVINKFVLVWFIAKTTLNLTVKTISYNMWFKTARQNKFELSLFWENSLFVNPLPLSKILLIIINYYVTM